MIAALAEIGSLVLKGVTDYIKGKQEVTKAELQNRARLLRDREQYNHDWEMAQLADRDRWLRRISFAMFSLPVLLAYFDPEQVKAYFDVALQAMPEWYIKTYMGMVGAIWGIVELKRAVPQLIGPFKKGDQG